jgi:S1-C subfamily serine protease
VLVFVLVRSPSSDTAARARAAPTTTTSPLDSAAVYQHILPSLVLVRAHDNANLGDDVLGSGVIINAGGLIMTADHVVSDTSNIEVTFADGTTSAATVRSASPENDIAVLVPDHGPSVIVPAVLAGGGLKIGDATFSAGNPLGFAGSFTAGVISGLDRTVPRPDGSGWIQDVIQFDAAVNSGSSGGPLLNRQGQVIGIITGLANPTDEGVFIGIGFAVPIQTAGGAAHAPPR